MSGPALLRATHVSATLGGRRILDGVDLAVTAGEFIGVVGPNGAGKTTLLRAIAGLVPAAGKIVLGEGPLAGLPLAERAKRLSYLPQGHLFHWPLPVADIVALGRLPRGAGADLSVADRAAVERAMQATGVTEFAHRAVTTLSGGERARVALARVLATEAPLVLADEPTASLDPRYQLLVLDILKRHAAGGGAVVAVLHDLGLAGRYADRVVVIDQGRLVVDGHPADVLTRDLLADRFGVAAEIVALPGGTAIIPWALTDRPAPGPGG